MSAAYRNGSDSREVQPVKTLTKRTNSAKFSGKSPAVEAQRARILAALKHGPKTSHQLRCAGIYQVSARIKELREMGYRIHTHRVNLVDSDGYWHPRCALYSLERDAT